MYIVQRTYIQVTALVSTSILKVEMTKLRHIHTVSESQRLESSNWKLEAISSDPITRIRNRLRNLYEIDDLWTLFNIIDKNV